MILIPQSWESLDLNEHYFYPMNHLISNCPSTNELSAVLKPHIESVEKIELRDLKPVPLQKVAQIHVGIFILVNPKVSLWST